MSARTIIALFALGAIDVGCSTAASPRAVVTDVPDAAAHERSSVDATVACEAAPIALLTERAGDTLSRVYVEAALAGKRVALMLDTGSATTFLAQPVGTPDPQRHAGDIVVGTCTIAVDGRPYPSNERIGGLAVVGSFGADALLGAPAAELDLAGEKLFRHLVLPIPEEVLAWPSVPLEIVQGHLIVSVVVDGQRLRLMVDTGSQHLLWLGKSGEPGDDEVETSDAEGNVLQLYLGTADLTLGDAPSQRVPILRAPSFPYFEETVRILGGNIQGLLGLSALGRRRIVVDRDAGRVRFGR